jgi:hypothetical protein
MRAKVALSVLLVAAAAACYHLYDGLEDQWTVYYSLQPAAGAAAGSCEPTVGYGTIELFRERNAGLRGTFDRDSLACTSMGGSVTVGAGRDSIISGQVFDLEQDSLEFTFGNPAWVFRGSQIERHMLRGFTTLTANDSVVFTGWWQAERR